jgi:hypothetical protein
LPSEEKWLNPNRRWWGSLAWAAALRRFGLGYVVVAGGQQLGMGGWSATLRGSSGWVAGLSSRLVATSGWDTFYMAAAVVVTLMIPS